MESQTEEYEQIWMQAVKVLQERGLGQRDAVIAADYAIEVLRAQERSFN